jgi:hypothetical protein
MERSVAARDREERRLARRLARRDPDALRALYDLHGGAIFGALQRVLGDRAAAEDVQQQVFLEAWQRAERFDPERGGLRTWLLTIARSRAIDHLRRRCGAASGGITSGGGSGLSQASPGTRSSLVTTGRRRSTSSRRAGSAVIARSKSAIWASSSSPSR